MRGSLSVLTEILRLQTWVVPASAAGLAGIAALVVVWAEQSTSSLSLPIDIEPVSARALLSAVSSAMISFTGLVFTVRSHLRAMLVSLRQDAPLGREPAVRRALARFDTASDVGST